MKRSEGQKSTVDSVSQIPGEIVCQKEFRGHSCAIQVVEASNINFTNCGRAMSWPTGRYLLSVSR